MNDNMKEQLAQIQDTIQSINSERTNNPKPEDIFSGEFLSVRLFLFSHVITISMLYTSINFDTQFLFERLHSQIDLMESMPHYSIYLATTVFNKGDSLSTQVEMAMSELEYLTSNGDTILFCNWFPTQEML